MSRRPYPVFPVPTVADKLRALKVLFEAGFNQTGHSYETYCRLVKQIDYGPYIYVINDMIEFTRGPVVDAEVAVGCATRVNSLRHMIAYAKGLL